jgi:hypothetical protein
MHEDRLLELIRQRRDLQRSRLQGLERRGLYIIGLVALLGAAISATVGGNMSSVWGSMLLAGLFVILTGLLIGAIGFAGAVILPLEGLHLFYGGDSSRARRWDRWLTEKGFSGRPLAEFRSLLPLADEDDEDEETDEDDSAAPEAGAEETPASPAATTPRAPRAPAPPPMTEEEKVAFRQERLSAFLAATVLGGQRIDLSVDPLLRSEVQDYWSVWFVAERSAGLLRRAISMALIALALSGFASIQLAEEAASSAQSSRGGPDGGKAGKGGKSGGPDGGMEGGKSGKGGGLEGGMEGGKTGKGGGLEGGLEGGKAGKGGGMEGGKAGKGGGLEDGRAGKGGGLEGGLEGTPEGTPEGTE